MDKVQLRMLVFCTNASGMPDICRCTVEVTRAQYHDGYHYDLARAQAREEGYEGEMVLFDPFDASPIAGVTPAECIPLVSEEAVLETQHG